MAAHKLYIRIGRNEITIRNLLTGEVYSGLPTSAYDTPRVVVSDFLTVENLISKILSAHPSGKPKWYQATQILIQQTEGIEGGLSFIEKRALRDLAELAGGKKNFILEDTREYTTSEALLVLKNAP